MLEPDALGNRIRLEDVRTYSYLLPPLGRGTIGIWALSKCGWFQVTPATQYQAIYDQMIQDLRLLDFVENFYNIKFIRKRNRKKMLPGEADDIYAKVNHSSCHT